MPHKKTIKDLINLHCSSKSFDFASEIFDKVCVTTTGTISRASWSLDDNKMGVQFVIM